MTEMKHFESLDDFKRTLDLAFKGKYSAQGRLREAYTSSELPVLFYQTVMPEFLAGYGDLKDEQLWPKIATKELLNDFRPAQFMELESNADTTLADNAGMPTPNGTLPLVPELTPYPTFGYAGQGSWITTKKHGARMQFSFEAFLNDQWGIIERFPADAALLASRTEDVAVLYQLFNGSGLDPRVFSDANGTVLQAKDTSDGFLSVDVKKNSPLTYDAIQAAIWQIANTRRNGRAVSVPEGYVLLVSPALKPVAERAVQEATIKIVQDNTTTEMVRHLAASVEVVASPWVSEMATDKTWVLLPKGGRADGKAGLIKTGLRGYEQPDLRMSNKQGLSLAGGAIPFTEGSFDNDDAEVRVRTITGSGLVSYSGIIGSNGTGS